MPTYFLTDHKIKYLHYMRENNIMDARLLLGFEHGDSRRTFAFNKPEFADVSALSLLAAKNIQIVCYSDSKILSVEIIDEKGTVYISAHSCVEITPK